MNEIIQWIKFMRRGQIEGRDMILICLPRDLIAKD